LWVPVSIWLGGLALILAGLAFKGTVVRVWR
jgi:hypothetical protein